MGIVQIVLNNILRYYGANSVYGSDIPIACVGVISKVNQVFMAICIGISQGSQPIWGFNYGAKKYDRVRQAYRYSVTACTVIATMTEFDSHTVFLYLPVHLFQRYSFSVSRYFHTRSCVSLEQEVSCIFSLQNVI